MQMNDSYGEQAAQQLKETKICGCESGKFAAIFNMILALILVAFSIMTFMTWTPHGNTVIVVYCFRVY